MKKHISKLISIAIITILISAILPQCLPLSAKSTTALSSASPSSSTTPSDIQYEIRALVKLYENEEPYDFVSEPGSIIDVLFVYEYPVFSGNSPAVEKLNKLYQSAVAEVKNEHQKAEDRKVNGFYTDDDYVKELVPHPHSQSGEVYFDITTCTVYYNNDYNIVSTVQSLGWYMGGVYDKMFEGNTFNTVSGAKLEINDILKGSKSDIYAMLQREYEKEYDELMSVTNGDMTFFLSPEGLNYYPHNHYGYQRGAVLTIPYSRKEIFNPLLLSAANQSASSWALADINNSRSLGLLPASLDSNYKQNITRAEFCRLAAPIYEKIRGNISTTQLSGISFTDTKDTDVLKMAYVGVVNGVGNNRFNPDGEITRQEAAIILVRLMEALQNPIPPTKSTFADIGLASSWAQDYIGKIQVSGIMGGVGNNRFDPLGKYTREQSIATLMRVWAKVT